MMIMRNKIAILIGFFVLLFASHIKANPIFPDLYGMSGDGNLFLFVALSAMVVEFFAIRFAFRKWLKLKDILPAFLLINLISFMLTTFLTWWIAWFAEILPLAIEPFMYKRYVCKPRKIEIPNLAIRVIIANLISFAYGLIAYHLIAAMRTRFYF